MKGKNIEITRRNFLKGSLATAAGIILGKAIAQAYETRPGKLDIQNYTNSDFRNVTHTAYHLGGCLEGFDGGDIEYVNVLFNPSGVNAKIVSKIPSYELLADGRPLESGTPINLELSLHSQSGDPITVSDMENKLLCSMPLAESHDYDFGIKPITLWRRDMANPAIIYFMADVREAIEKSNFAPSGIKTARIPLPNLDGTYNSEDPYMLAQVRFDVFPGDFNLDGKVDLRDFPHLSGDWRHSGNGLLGDIAGPNGLPDGIVNWRDTKAFSDDYLKDANDPNTW